MQWKTGIAVLFGVLLAACGDDKPKEPAAKPATPPAATPSATPPPAAGPWVGTVEVMGPSIHMQGSHKLVEGGKTVVLLESKGKKVDLRTWEGQRVSVKGTASATVEGGQTIVDVEEISKAP